MTIGFNLRRSQFNERNGEKVGTVHTNITSFAHAFEYFFSRCLLTSADGACDANAKDRLYDSTNWSDSLENVPILFQISKLRV